MISLVHDFSSTRAFQHSTNPPLVSSLATRSSPTASVGSSLDAEALGIRHEMEMDIATATKRETFFIGAMIYFWEFLSGW